MSSNLLQTIDFVFDLVEKIRKLIFWEDQTASTIVLVFLLIAFFVVTFIPLRFVIILWLFGKFSKGSRYYKRRYIGNRECCRIELRNFFLDQRLLSFETLFGDETQWLSAPWPKNQDNDLLKEHFQKIFSIILPNQFWEKFPTPSKLVDEVGFVDEALHLNFSDTKNQWDVRNNTKLYWPSLNPLFYVV